MKYYIIAGEASGDLHGSNLVKELVKKSPNAQFRGWGGDRMESAGVNVVKHYKDIAFMGFLEVIKNLFKILQLFKFCKKDISTFRPEIVILIDYPGFNLRMLPFLKKNGFRVVYYISPQVWAWKASRVRLIKKYVDLMLVILPFEKAFYAKYGVDAKFVGHPLLDALPDAEYAEQPANRKIALLPGSRKQEVQLMLPVMLKLKRSFPEYCFVIAGMSHLGEDFYAQFTSDYDVELSMNQTYNILKDVDAAIVTSGTATLETGIIGTPQIVVYKGSKLSYMIGKRLVIVPYISLVNLILDKPSVKELIQEEFTERKLTDALKAVLNPEIRMKMIEDYKTLKKKLGGKGASSHAADEILKLSVKN